AFGTFEFDGRDYIDDRRNDETGRTYRADMRAWVALLGERLRKGDPQRLLVPQNGSQLVADGEYLRTISGIGLEDVFTEGNRRQPRGEVRSRVDDVKPLLQAG